MENWLKKLPPKQLFILEGKVPMREVVRPRLMNINLSEGKGITCSLLTKVLISCCITGHYLQGNKFW